MSEGINRRPSLWSNLSWNKAPSRDRRTSSIASQLRPNDKDPFEKPGRINDPSLPMSAPSLMSNRWLKALAVVAIFGLALFFLGPRDSIENVYPHVKDQNAATTSAAKITSSPGTAQPKTPPPALNEGQSAVDPSIGTAKCDKSVHKDKPLIQYALMVDAGSTGSRIHVYRFNNCHETPELEEETFEMTKPGLSSYKGDPEGAAKSLDSLLQVAMDKVPEKLKSCSPIALKATAGLRLLGEEASATILKAVRSHLETYPFPVVAGNGVSIMDGSDEGVYAWITTNYLLGKIGSVEEIPTAAVFDLGGGSTQIVFEPTFPSIGGGMPETLAAGDHKYDLKFGGRHFALYQHSHLGLGLMEARRRVHEEVARTAKEQLGDSWNKRPLINPCINVGQQREVEVQISDDKSVPAIKINMTGPSDPMPAQCRYVAEKLLNKDSECALAPCSFNGIHQPSLARTFAKEDLYIFSYFYDRLRPLGMPDSFTLKEMAATTEKVCAGKEAWDVFSPFEGALEELADRPEYCLDLSFMISLLRTGYELPLDREVKIAKKIKGNELGWCLGASLPLLSGEDWQCKLTQL